MTWRAANAALTIASGVLFMASNALWVWAWQTNEIGNTVFIGHVSMAALSLACAAMMTGYLAAWRADVPTDEANK